jgi:aerobic-type carbon monoxide dehydrogenase small subunit (CoxS/CutS family)
MAIDLELNGAPTSFDADPETPLLYLLMNDAALKGPRFGCGLAQCGACSVLVDGVETRSCVTPVAAVEGRRVTTLEGMLAWYAEQTGATRPPDVHPVQQALIDEQAAQCGYCYNGMVMKAAELLATNPSPTDDEIVAHMNGHLCRCGTYPRIVRAIRRASVAMAGGQP